MIAEVRKTNISRRGSRGWMKVDFWGPMDDEIIQLKKIKKHLQTLRGQAVFIHTS